MKIKLITILAASAMVAPAFAQQVPSEGRDLASAQFAQMDADSNGSVTLVEYATQGGNIFVSMDSDDNSIVTENEFVAWDYGNADVAAKLGTSQAYAAARAVMFDAADTNFDWKLTPGEMSLFIANDFVQCDASRDGEISLDEYLGNSSINIAFRAALMPPENRQPK